MFLLIIYKIIYYGKVKQSTTWNAGVRNQTESTMDEGEGSPKSFHRLWQENATRENWEKAFPFYSLACAGESKQSAVRWSWNFPDATSRFVFSSFVSPLIDAT